MCISLYSVWAARCTTIMTRYSLFVLAQWKDLLGCEGRGRPETAYSGRVFAAHMFTHSESRSDACFFSWTLAALYLRLVILLKTNCTFIYTLPKCIRWVDKIIQTAFSKKKKKWCIFAAQRKFLSFKKNIMLHRSFSVELVLERGLVRAGHISVTTQCKRDFYIHLLFYFILMHPYTDINIER